MQARINDLDAGQLEILRLIAENTAMTQAVSAGTAELIDFFGAMKGAFKVMGWIGALAKPMGVVIGLFGGAVLAWTSFKGWFSR